jgi:hypothetical protein
MEIAMKTFTLKSFVLTLSTASVLGSVSHNAMAQTAKSTVNRNAACFLLELQRTDGYQPSAEENNACFSPNAVSNAVQPAVVVAHNAKQDRATECFLLELQRTDGWHPSAVDGSNCAAKEGAGPTRAAETKAIVVASRKPREDRGLACFLAQMRMTDGYQPSPEDRAACEPATATKRTQIAATGR